GPATPRKRTTVERQEDLKSGPAQIPWPTCGIPASETAVPAPRGPAPAVSSLPNPDPGGPPYPGPPTRGSSAVDPGDLGSSGRRPGGPRRRSHSPNSSAAFPPI